MALVGLEGRIVEVEADIGAGLPRTVLVGLPDSALYQARDRCKAAVSNSSQEWPISLLTINLSPATLPKAGSHYDLAIVAAILAAQGTFRAEELRRTVLLGELGLDGRVRPIRGVLPATLAAQQAGFSRVIVPLRQAGEAKLVAGIDVFGIASITQLVAFLRGEPMPLVDPIEVMGDPAGKHAKRRLDLADVVGQVEAKWACEVAAAGRHHMLFHGPPGVGKTMLAERVPGLLPDLDLHDSLEVSAVHSLAGFNLADELITRPPYSDPHHSASVASIVGGGQRMARPGAISCAHARVSLCSMWNSSAALAQLRDRGRHGDPTHDRYHDSDYGDDAGDGSENLRGTGPQTPIQLLPSTANKHHFELLPSMLAQVTTQQQPPRVVVAGPVLPSDCSAPNRSKE